MAIRHRLFVLTDIENEPDDTQSLVRLLLYSNEIDLEGLVAVSSTWIRHAVRPDSIRDVIKGYATVRPNLLRVYSTYPEPEQLLKLVGEGAPLYGMQGVGEGHDSTGSEMLIRAADKEDEQGRPLHVALWGGANCLAQVSTFGAASLDDDEAEVIRPCGKSGGRGSSENLCRLRTLSLIELRSPEDVAKFVSRLTVYGISDQDDAGPWIRRNFPMLQYVVSVHGENVYMGATWIGFASDNRNGLPGADPALISKEWLKQNVQYGPLGSKYPDVMYGMEGDTPSYLNCIPVSLQFSLELMMRVRHGLHVENGLNDPERPDFGGWGGRYKLIFDPEAQHYHEACDTVIAHGGAKQFSAAATIYRWRDTVQRDLAARMQWTTETDEKKLGISPVVVVDGDKTPAFITKKVKCGDTVEVDASESFSPSGSELSFRWYQYKEIGSVMPMPFEVPDFDMHGTESTPKLRITAPKETGHAAGHWRREFDSGRVYHVILEVTSEGDIPLTRYRRILLDVTP